jgi:hybrid cluster-associated redox disulfide protein
MVMEYLHLSADLTVDEVLDRWPETIPTFFRYRMACVGCPMAPFETLLEVAAIYGLDLDCFLSELERVIQLKKERV